jgi:hypothetical protein
MAGSAPIKTKRCLRIPDFVITVSEHEQAGRGIWMISPTLTENFDRPASIIVFMKEVFPCCFKVSRKIFIPDLVK